MIYEFINYVGYSNSILKFKNKNVLLNKFIELPLTGGEGTSRKRPAEVEGKQAKQ